MVPRPQRWQAPPTLRLARRSKGHVAQPACCRQGNQNCAIPDHAKAFADQRVPWLEAWEVLHHHSQRQRGLPGKNLKDKTCLNSQRTFGEYIAGIEQKRKCRRSLLVNDCAVATSSRITQQGDALTPPYSPPLAGTFSALSFVLRVPASFASFAVRACLASFAVLAFVD